MNNDVNNDVSDYVGASDDVSDYVGVSDDVSDYIGVSDGASNGWWWCSWQFVFVQKIFVIAFMDFFSH